MKDIDTALRHIRSFTLAVIAGCVLICCCALYKSLSLVSQMQSKIYILANGKVLEAYASERKDNILVEGRDHIKTFHQLFFTLDPDDKVIDTNITKALYLADVSAKHVRDDMKENGYYASIISGNVHQTIAVDSVVINVNEYPYHFRCYATQTVMRPTSLTTRDLLTEGELQNVSRSDNNPHGFLIARWNMKESKDLNTVKRN